MRPLEEKSALDLKLCATLREKKTCVNKFHSVSGDTELKSADTTVAETHFFVIFKKIVPVLITELNSGFNSLTTPQKQGVGTYTAE